MQPGLSTSIVGTLPRVEQGLPEVVAIGNAGHVCSVLVGVNPSRASFERWHRRGIRGTRLATFLLGGRRYVRVEELRRFLDAMKNSDPSRAA